MGMAGSRTGRVVVRRLPIKVLAADNAAARFINNELNKE
jgi:hypothetical protein